MRKLKTELWPYQITIPVSNNGKLDDRWCDAYIGRRFRDWYSFNVDHNKRLFAFKDEETLLVFKLKWGYNGN